jgi:hypothetical protein
MADTVIDTSSFDKGLEALEKKIQLLQRKAVRDIAEEILRLANFEVPHDTGQLQNSGSVEPQAETADRFVAIIGYNKHYAARLHEHPEYKFQKGRKGKFLEDPIKRNLDVFREFYREILSQAF